MRYLFLLLLFISAKIRNLCKEELKIHAIRFKTGARPEEEIQNYVQEHKIEAGWIMTCAGSITHNIICGSPTNPTDPKSQWPFWNCKSYRNNKESINGSHLHMSVSDSTGKNDRRSFTRQQFHLYHCRNCNRWGKATHFIRRKTEQREWEGVAD